MSFLLKNDIEIQYNPHKSPNYFFFFWELAKIIINLCENPEDQEWPSTLEGDQSGIKFPT